MGLCSSAAANKSKSSEPYYSWKVDALTRSKVSSAALATPKLEGEILKAPHLKRFPFNELKTATRNFSACNFLGEGTFGWVYKGFIDQNSLQASASNTGMGIAVKMLNQKGFQGQQEWLSEIKNLGQLCHPNLVRLIGYCTEEYHQLLVYEYMPKGSLEKHLFSRDFNVQHGLSWDIRMKVALGVAKGLAFLHDKAQVIHRDFKASNILLDSEYNAKISDFGLAKDGPIGDKTHVTTRIMGSAGYLAPEYKNAGYLTTKADVYSFGVVLLELISGRPAADKNRQHFLVDWAIPLLKNKRKIFLVVDNGLEGNFAKIEVLKAASLALWCLSATHKTRPDMEAVVKTLEDMTLKKFQHTT